MNELVCEEGQCCGCHLCQVVCPKKAITVLDELNKFNSVIDEKLCIKCNLCHKNCPMNLEPQKKYPEKWFQGWSKDSVIRGSSSSGGIARIISENFIKGGGVVCSCMFENGIFGFKIVDSVGELHKFQGSKYVKSNPGLIYKDIKSNLKSGKKVLFIGLPCQAQAVRNYVGIKSQNSLYTVDLICHGTPSIKLLNIFLEEHNQHLDKIQKIEFRSQDGFGIKTGTKIEVPGVMDRYSIAFLNSICYTENCYNCKFASVERASDLTIGDSWGSDIISEARNGISLMLCQNKKGLELISHPNIELRDVNLDHAVANNPQLQKACERPVFHQKFFEEIKEGRTVDSVVFKYQKKKSIKQMIKKVLIKLHLLKIGGDCLKTRTASTRHN